MANTPRPTARSIIVCEKIVPEPDHPIRVCLVRVINSIRAAVGVHYPVRHQELAVFAQLTECRGTGRVRIEIRNSETNTVVARTNNHLMTFPNEPLTVYGFRFRVQDILFPEPGLYWVQLCYDDGVIAQTPITLLPGTLPPPLRGANSWPQ